MLTGPPTVEFSFVIQQALALNLTHQSAFDLGICYWQCREAESITVKPASLARLVWFPAERLYQSPVPALEGIVQALTQLGVPAAHTMKDLGCENKTSCITPQFSFHSQDPASSVLSR
jgi:hypothetical protein